MTTACAYHRGSARPLFGLGECLDLAAGSQRAAKRTPRPPLYPRTRGLCGDGQSASAARCREADYAASPPALATCSNSNSTAAPLPRVGLCLAGHPRTFTRPHVYNSIRSNLIGGLNARVDVVAIMSLAYLPPKLHGWASPPSDSAVSTTALQKALAAIRPRAVVLDNDSGGGGAGYGTGLNPRCATPHGFMGSDAHGSGQHVMRTVAQPASWSACLDLLEGFEREDGARYAFVVRSRPDAWWFRPHPAASCLSPRVIYVHDWLDMHFVLPREAAPAIMRGMLHEYTNCNATFPHAALEAWLRHTVVKLVLASQPASTEPAPSASPLAPLWVTQLIFPFALIRNDSKQSDAWW